MHIRGGGRGVIIKNSGIMNKNNFYHDIAEINLTHESLHLIIFVKKKTSKMNNEQDNSKKHL